MHTTEATSIPIYNNNMMYNIIALYTSRCHSVLRIIHVHCIRIYILCKL
jgi:hypothetical protein